ncbi:MAG: hypothetical protein JSV15_01660 [Candidatus Bathyarchaeota archaeon]|nr:MAG: hypothetical protein JSV15_01660 [Candidatus Bathyarchaeota archaeon]
MFPTVLEVCVFGFGDFAFTWNPNRWPHKTELLIITGIAAMFPAINAILATKFGKYGRDMLLFFGAIFIAVIALFFGIITTIVNLSILLSRKMGVRGRCHQKGKIRPDYTTRAGGGIYYFIIRNKGILKGFYSQ